MVSTRFPDEATRITKAWLNGERKKSAGYVTEEMVATLGISGRPDEARAELRDLHENPVINHPIITFPHQTAGQLAEATMEALAPERIDG